MWDETGTMVFGKEEVLLMKGIGIWKSVTQREIVREREGEKKWNEAWRERREREERETGRRALRGGGEEVLLLIRR